MMVETSSKSTGHIMRTVKIMDLEGLNSSHFDWKGLKYLKHLIAVSQHNYPEMLGHLYIVNIPWLFNAGWKIIKPWLEPHTIEKITILQNHEFKQKLLEQIEADQLPEFLGGTCTCSSHGGCCPLLDVNEGMQYIQVGSRSNIRCIVEIPNTCTVNSNITMHYEFRTVAHDIGLSIAALYADGRRKELLGLKRYKGDEGLVVGDVRIDTTDGVPSKIELLFDNSYSLFTSKQVYWCAEIEIGTANSSTDGKEAEEGTEDMEQAELQRVLQEASINVQLHENDNKRIQDNKQ